MIEKGKVTTDYKGCNFPFFDGKALIKKHVIIKK